MNTEREIQEACDRVSRLWVLFKSKFVVSVIFATGLSGLASLPAVAKEAGKYGGFRYAALERVSEYYMSDRSWDTPTLIFNAGYQVNPIFAIEGRFGIGVGDDTTPETADGRFTAVTTEIDDYVGVFARIGVPAGDFIYPYFQVGEGRTSITREIHRAPAVNSSGNYEDIAYGFGIEFGKGKVAGSVEYMNYYDEDDEVGDNEKFSGISFGAVFRF